MYEIKGVNIQMLYYDIICLYTKTIVENQLAIINISKTIPPYLNTMIFSIEKRHNTVGPVENCTTDRSLKTIQWLFVALF